MARWINPRKFSAPFPVGTKQKVSCAADLRTLQCVLTFPPIDPNSMVTLASTTMDNEKAPNDVSIVPQSRVEENRNKTLGGQTAALATLHDGKPQICMSYNHLIHLEEDTATIDDCTRSSKGPTNCIRNPNFRSGASISCFGSLPLEHRKEIWRTAI